MGLMRKRDEEERAYIEGIEIIERSDTPDDLDASPVAVGTAGGDAPEVDADALRAADGAEDGASDGEEADSLAAGEPESDDGLDDDATADDGERDAGDDDTDDVEGADDAADLDEASDAEPGALARLLSNPRLVVACLVIVAVAAGIIGYVVGAGILIPHGTGSATLEEDQLDTPVASYTYGGATHQITAREALESAYILSNIENDDGTYPAPSAEVTVACARRSILIAEARSRGIEATDDELAAYAKDTLGTDDFAAIAKQYDTTEDQVHEITEGSLLIEKLYEQIVPGAASLTAPTMPASPEDGNEDTASAEYASYIIDLAGDEWDAGAGTWARTDGPYYQALSGESFTADSATYAQALTAYYVAYQTYSDAANEAQSAWTVYANGIYEDVDLTVYGLYQ